MIFQTEAVKQRFLLHRSLAHHRSTPRFHRNTESRLHNAGKIDFFNTIRADVAMIVQLLRAQAMAASRNERRF